MTVRFTNGTSGTLSYSMNGITVNKSIQQFVFGAAPTCVSTTGSRATAANYQDLWWNASEPGWGLALAHQGNTIFAAMFNYNNVRRDVWLAAANMGRQLDGSFVGELSYFSGSAFNTLPWGVVTPSPVGTMTLRFNSGETGTLSYSVLGVTVIKNISRFVFGASAPICNQ